MSIEEPPAKKVKKSKKEKKTKEETEEETTQETVVISYEDQLKNANKISSPIGSRWSICRKKARFFQNLQKKILYLTLLMADKKLTKRIYKSIAKAKTSKNMLRRGLKEVTKALKKKEKGFVIFAGDVTPIDIYCHLIPWCEKLNLPYAFTPSKQLLGATISSKRPTCVLLVREDDKNSEYSKALAGVKALHE